MKRNKRSATVSHCNMPCCSNSNKDDVQSPTTAHLENNGQTRRKKTKNDQKSHKGKKSSQSSTQQAAQLAGGGDITHKNKQAVSRLHQKRKRGTVPHQSPSSNFNQEENDIQVLQVSEDEETSTSEKSTSSDEEESDNDEGFINFRDIISSHSNNITGNALEMTQFVEPVSTPISHSIPKSVIKKIQTNKFVDFSRLLPNMALPQAENYSLTLNANNHLSLVPNSSSRKIQSIETWTTAFLRFSAIYAATFPHEMPQLMKYGEIVRDLARRRQGLGWSFYDNQFRMFRERELMPWDRIHTEFWVMATSQLAPHHNGSFQSNRPFRTGSSRQFKSGYSYRKPSKFLENTCWTFNRRGLCRELTLCTFFDTYFYLTVQGSEQNVSYWVI